MPEKTEPPAKASTALPIVTTVRNYWQPKPLEEPKLDPHWHRLDRIQRSGEVLVYSILRAEYWISPHGALREWLRFNLVASLTLAIPALFIVPIVTFLLWQCATWAEYLHRIAKNLLVFPVAFIVMVAIGTALAAVGREWWRKNRQP